MKQTLKMIVLTAFLLVLLDVIVAAALSWMDRSGRILSLVRYFEYGRTVPGKLERWQKMPWVEGNLFDVAWMQAGLAQSAEAHDPAARPKLRSYGMSFVNNIIGHAVKQGVLMEWDNHGGPAVPPNYTYAYFEDDRPNRNAGDVVVLGILSSSLPAMAALSNRTWAFEQPAPFTYPVYHPDGEGLRRVDPLVQTAEAERNLSENPTLQAAWQDQLALEDGFYGPHAFGFTWLDASPFARLVRRSWATSTIRDNQAGIVAGDAYPYAEVLRRMITGFARTARADGQIPIVMLVQSREPADSDVLALLGPTLRANDIPYFATADHFAPNDPSGFVSDGHYRADVDQMFGTRFRAQLDALIATN